MFAAISSFWFAAQLVSHASLNRDDWYFVAKQMGWPAFWRPISVTVGVVTYAATIRVVIAALPRPSPNWLPPVRLAYASGVASAVIAGLMWRPEPIHGAVEALLTLGVNPLGLLLAARLADRDAREGIAAAPIARSWRWIVTAALVFATFALLQGRGLGPLAGFGLHGGD